MNKFYHAENARRTFGVTVKKDAASGQIIRSPGIFFEGYDIIAGSLFGVYKTDDASEIAILDALVKDRKSAVTEISEAEYTSTLQKKTLALQSSEPSNRASAPAQPLKGPGAVVVEEPSAPAVKEKAIETTEDALKVGDAEQHAATPVVDLRAEGLPTEVEAPVNPPVPKSKISRVKKFFS